MILPRNQSIVVCCFSLLLTSATALVAAQPTVSGKVLRSTSSRPEALRDATVRLFKPDTNDVVAQTYSDTWGVFAFYNLGEGTYDMQINLGQAVLKQRSGDQLKDRVRIEVPRVDRQSGKSAGRKLADVVVESG